MITEQMTTLCLLGSPRRAGNSDLLAGRFCEYATRIGAPVNKVALSDLSYNGCRNLFRCKQDLDHCVQNDDLTPVLDAVSNAQVLVLASPIYFTSISGQLKLAIDRFFSFFLPDYAIREDKSRLSSGRHLVFVQSQGEAEDRYGDLMDGFSAGFRGLGFDKQHLIRAWGVREPGDVASNDGFLSRCDEVAMQVYGAGQTVQANRQAAGRPDGAGLGERTVTRQQE